MINAGTRTKLLLKMRARVSFILNPPSLCRPPLRCPVHPLPPTGPRPSRNISFSYRRRGTCQPVKYKLKPSI